ncbi:MAG: TolB family protein [Phycisphaerales bacterium]|jgi:Tol biopolymer transport system component
MPESTSNASADRRTPSVSRTAPALAIAAMLSLLPSVGCVTPGSTVPARKSVSASATPAETASAAAPSGGAEANTTWDDEVSLASGGGWDTIPLTRRARSASFAADAGGLDGGLSDGGGNLAQVSFATEGGDYAPDIDRTGSFMVYASTQHRPTFDIYRKSVDGRTVTQLTTDPSDDLMPALAPDGSRIAFASNRNGNWDIYIMPIGGGAPTQITSDSDDEVQPTWAPDGRRIAFSRKNGRTNTWEIWVVDTTNPGLRSYVCEGFLPRWSPEERRDVLLFQRARQRGSRLYGIWTIELVRGEGLSPTEIVSARNAAVLQPGWSPDGSKIVFTSVVNPGGDSEWPEQSDIWIINADGTRRMGLTNGRFRNMQPTWGADGRVYFVSNRGGIENIWSMAADGGQEAAGSVEFAAETRRKNEAFDANGAVAPSNNAAARMPANASANGTPDLLRSSSADE